MKFTTVQWNTDEEMKNYNNKLEKVFELYALVGILSVSKLYQNDSVFGLTRTEILKKFGLFLLDL